MLNDKDRLFIKKIEIKNCGRFYGDDHVIHLSDPSEKNVTIILGDSGVGKSTIHDLIYWCLYGSFKNYGDEGYDEDYGHMNMDVLNNLKLHDSETASVTLTLHDNRDLKYILHRELIATFHHESTSRKFKHLNNSKANDGIDFESNVKLTYRNNQGEFDVEKKEKIINNEINKFFPQNLSDFFLFDGEKLIKFRTKSTAASLIKNGIEKISGLTLIDSIIGHSKLCEDLMTKEIGGKIPNSAPTMNDIKRLESDIDKFRKDHDNKNREYNVKKRNYAALIINISKTEDNSELLKQITSKKNDIKVLKKELNENNKKFKDFIYDRFPQLLIKKILQSSEIIFERLEKNEQIPPGITRRTVDKILNSEPPLCICGKEFQKDDESWVLLNKIKTSILNDDISQGISIGRMLIGQKIDSVDKQKLKMQFDKHLDIRREKQTKISELNEEIDSLTEQYSGDDDDDNLLEMKKHIEREMEDIHGDILGLDQKIDSLLKEKSHLNDNLSKIISRENRFDTENSKIILSKAIHKILTNVRQQIVDDLRKKTESATSKYYLESAPEKETISEVQISSNYDITARDASGYIVKLSKGMAHVLGLSYVSGIRDITNTNTFLIIDSPLHNISGISRNEISDVLSKYLPGVQLILLVTDSEYIHGDLKGAKPVRDILRNNGKIWKEYIINKVTINNIHSRRIEEYVE